MKVIVCGGRDFTDEGAVFRVLNDVLNESPTGYIEVIEGGARGADALAARWATRMARVALVVRSGGVKHTQVRADWERHGKRAGHLRNAEMLTLKPDLVVAFPGGKGTMNMVVQARHAGVEVRRIGW